MKYSIKTKLIVSYLFVALLTVLIVTILIRLTSSQSLMNLVVEQQTARLSEAVQAYYRQNGTLEGFTESLRNEYDHRDFRPPSEPDSFREKPPFERDVRGLYGLVDADYRALLPTLGYSIGKIVPSERIREKIAVEVDGKTIAWILPDTSHQFSLSPEEELFLRRTTIAIVFAAFAGVLSAIAIGFFLAGRLLHPIRLLTQAAGQLARGNLNQQVPVTSQDELGLLTATFNQMSADLLQADQQRKRLTADITHDLSTPLQIISGYIEMLETNEVALTPQRIQIIKDEIEHLRRLVGDLTTLTQVESNGLEITLQPTDPIVLLERVYATFAPIAARQGITLHVVAPPTQLPLIYADEGRMVQVLSNLLENALRYTHNGGNIWLRACADAAQVNLLVQDDGAGIEAEDLPYVFERFYRADKARSTASGKMGLGLAICKALVNAQNGTIRATSEGAGKGTTVTITFETVKR